MNAFDIKNSVAHDDFADLGHSIVIRCGDTIATLIPDDDGYHMAVCRDGRWSTDSVWSTDEIDQALTRC